MFYCFTSTRKYVPKVELVKEIWITAKSTKYKLVHGKYDV